jgi:thiamine pyrophosphokinase
VDIKQLKDTLSEKLENLFQEASVLTLIGPLPVFKDDFNDLRSNGVIYIDGGLNYHNLVNQYFCDVPYFSVGDGDSLDSKKTLDLTFPTSKDESDLSLVLSAIPKVCEHIHLLGFFGGRQDHFFCNIGEINKFLHQATESKLVTLTGQNQTLLCTNRKLFKFQTNSTFSVLTLSENTIGVTGECEYTCKEQIFEKAFSSLGLSNKGHGEITIT